MSKKFSLLALFFCFSFFPLLADNTNQGSITQIRQVELLKVARIDSSINPATLAYLADIYANTRDNDMVLIKMNTPGGLISTTKSILEMIGSSLTPTIIWVTPQGSSATSAGAIIASAAHILVMSDGTNIGAATPIQMGKDIDQKDIRSKAVNDLKALVKALAIARDRAFEPYEQMIEKAESFESHQAKQMNIIDEVINNEGDLLTFLNDKVIKIQGQPVKLKLNSQTKMVDIPMALGQKLLNILADPSLAYILFLMAIALIYLEFQAPGGFIAGALGVLFLILAGISFQVLPLNLGSLGLIILAFVLLILEIYVPSFGLLTLSALVSLVIGSIFLFKTADSFMDIGLKTIMASLFAIISFVLLMLHLFIRDLKKVAKNQDILIGKTGFVKKIEDHSNIGYRYKVMINAEIWNADSEDDLQEGSAVEVVSISDSKMILNIKKCNTSNL